MADSAEGSAAPIDSSDLPSGWAWRPLSELVDPDRGIRYGIVQPGKDVADGVPLVRVRDLADGRISSEGLKQVAREIAEPYRRTELKGGEILLSLVGTLGAVARVPESLIGANVARAVGVLPVPASDADYVVQALRGPAVQGTIRAWATTTVQATLNLREARQLPVPWPPAAERDAIAAVLGALDDKIELNRKMNRTLEEMAQAIFKSWFIDFDGHDDLVDSELGPIPRGWVVEALDSVAHFLNGAACQKFRPASGEDSLPVIKIRELNQGITDKTDRATVRIPQKWWVSDGDVLFSWSGSLVVKVWTGGAGALNQHLFKVTSDRFPRWFYLLWTTHHLREFQRIAAAKATTMGHIKRHHLTDAKCAVPSALDLEQVDRILRPLTRRQVINDLESRTLAALRNTLLPKLISGELRVPANASIDDLAAAHGATP